MTVWSGFGYVLNETDDEARVRREEGPVVCGAIEADCQCHESVGHDGPHQCGLENCLGQWTYNAEGQFSPVRFPGGQPVTPEGAINAMLSALFGEGP